MEKLPTPQEFLPETKIWDLMTKEKEIVWEAMEDYANLKAKFHVKEALSAAASSH